MAKLPVVSSGRTITAFEKAGWTVARQKGSHTTMVKPGVAAVLTIPFKKEMPRGTLRTLIRLAGMTVDEFNSYLK